MKTFSDLIEILIEDLAQVNFEVENTSRYYNNMTGDVSAIIAAILNKKLEEIEDWNSKSNWMDDCLISKIDIFKSKYRFWGIMIWGKDNTTEQWTDPFYFEFQNIPAKENYQGLIYFQDEEWESLPYSDFINERGIWDEDFYKSKKWKIKERKWIYKFSFNSTGKKA